MKNFIQDGDRVTVAAPYDRTSGQGALVGAIFGVCVADALSGATVVLARKGVYDLTKVGSQAWAIGDAIYWDDGNKRCTKTAAGATLIGAAMAVAGSGAGVTTGRVLLSGAPRPAEAP